MPPHAHRYVLVRSPAPRPAAFHPGRSRHLRPMAPASSTEGQCGGTRASSPRLRQPLRVWLRWHGFSRARAPALPTARLTNFAPWAAGVVPALAGSMPRGGALGCYVIADSRVRWRRWMVNAATDEQRCYLRECEKQHHMHECSDACFRQKQASRILSSRLQPLMYNRVKCPIIRNEQRERIQLEHSNCLW